MSFQFFMGLLAPLARKTSSSFSRTTSVVLAVAAVSPVHAAALSPAIQQRVASVYEGTCTPDKSFCAHFSPIEIPIHTVASYMKSAKKSIRIATYNMDVMEYVDLLKEKLDQGVKVEFGLDFKHSVSHGGVWGALTPHKNLVRYRLPVARGSNPQMHNKIIVIDNEVVLYGSANFTYSGLAANYENVLAIRDPNVIVKFTAEMDELRSNSVAACEIFTQTPNLCLTGTEKWSEPGLTLFTKGVLPASTVDTTSERQITLDDGTKKTIKSCESLVKESGGLLGVENLPKASLTACVKDESLRMKLIAFVDRVKENEKYSDGVSTSSVRRDKRPLPTEQNVDVYFGPEDNIQGAILRELDKALQNPADSFVLISTNFITNRAIAEKLVQLHQAKALLRVMFDRGRIEDPNFQAQIGTLSKIGLIKFDNALTGPYGSNHNKMAVVGVGSKLTLLNGSANWSSAGVNRNDENLLIIRDQEIAAIYTREIFSQLYVYAYGQDGDAFAKDYSFVQKRVPCLNALMGLKHSCVTSSGREWKMSAKSQAILSLGSAPAAPGERVWVWVRQIEEQYGIKALPLFTHETYAGRWLTSVPMPLNWDMQFKFFKVPSDYDPNTRGIPDSAWEYSSGADRTLKVAPIGVHMIRDMYTWGQH